MPVPIVVAYGIWQTYMGAFGSIKNITRSLQASAFPKDPYATVTLAILNALESGKLVFKDLKPETQNSIIQLLERYLTLPIGQTAGSSTPIGQATQQILIPSSQTVGSQITQPTSSGCMAKEVYQQPNLPSIPKHHVEPSTVGKICPAGYIWDIIDNKCKRKVMII